MPNTPRPSFDLSLHFPQLRKKMAVFLHPRHTAESLPVHVSKMGGHFYWPNTEPWPLCPLDDHPMVSVLQLRKDDVPEFGFPAGKTLLQVFWCPDQYHEETNYGPYPKCIWRYVPEKDNTELLKPHQVPTPVHITHEIAIPRQCRLHPERMEEYPDICEIEKISGTLYQDVESWVAENALEDLVELEISPEGNIYQYCSGAAPNSKVGGWVYWMNDIYTFTCTDCSSSMEQLLSISSMEYGGGAKVEVVPG